MSFSSSSPFNLSSLVLCAPSSEEENASQKFFTENSTFSSFSYTLVQGAFCPIEKIEDADLCDEIFQTFKDLFFKFKALKDLLPNEKSKRLFCAFAGELISYTFYVSKENSSFFLKFSLSSSGQIGSESLKERKEIKDLIEFLNDFSHVGGGGGAPNHHHRRHRKTSEDEFFGCGVGGGENRRLREVYMFVPLLVPISPHVVDSFEEELHPFLPIREKAEQILNALREVNLFPDIVSEDDSVRSNGGEDDDEWETDDDDDDDASSLPFEANADPLTAHLNKKRLEAIEKAEKEVVARDSLDLKEECIICLTNPRTVAVVPCGHVISCDPCAQKLSVMIKHTDGVSAVDGTKCPTCRGDVKLLLRLYA